MSEVFLALMSAACGSPKPVVIKRLWPELARDPEYVALFLDEARISLQMSHPNVVHAYESGLDGDRHYLTLEYLDGQPLKHLFDGVLAEGGLSLPLALKIVCDVLAGLDYIHGLQDLSGSPLDIVHRDVSPQNVFITYEGAVKLVDFGIAQFAGTRAAQPSRDLKGRIAYMAPEQVAGLAVDRRADLFSVGVMLWELAVGKRLWQGKNEADILQHLRERKPLPTLPKNRGFPPGLATICARALAVDPAERYASASHFLSDLGDLMTGSAPVQSRLLADLMGHLFRSARALTRAMIQQRLQGESQSPANQATDEPLRRSATGEYPTSRSSRSSQSSQSSARMEAVFDRSTNSGIATSGKEVTGVNPAVPDKATRTRLGLGRRQGLVVVLVMLAFAVGFEAVHVLTRRGSVHPGPQATATVPAPATAIPVPPPAPVPPPVTALPERPRPPEAVAADAVPTLAANPIFLRVPQGSKVHKRGTTPRTTPGTPGRRLTEDDFFDVTLEATSPRPGRTLDREDPYRR
jgi:eukaryotic-like serine/threonine-protein kinase